jgi:hypothetical protein
MTKKQKSGMLAGDLLNLLLLLLNLRKLLLKKRSTRRFWTPKWLKRRYFGRGLSSLFFEELAVEDKKSFKNFTKMSIRTFDHLLAKVGPKICRQNTTFKECISPRIRLLLKLRYLATGETFQSFIMASEFQYHLPYIPRLSSQDEKKNNNF